MQTQQTKKMTSVCKTVYVHHDSLDRESLDMIEQMCQTLPCAEHIGAKKAKQRLSDLLNSCDKSDTLVSIEVVFICDASLKKMVRNYTKVKCMPFVVSQRSVYNLQDEWQSIVEKEAYENRTMSVVERLSPARTGKFCNEYALVRPIRSCINNILQLHSYTFGVIMGRGGIGKTTALKYIAKSMDLHSIHCSLGECENAVDGSNRTQNQTAAVLSDVRITALRYLTEYGQQKQQKMLLIVLDDADEASGNDVVPQMKRLFEQCRKKAKQVGCRIAFVAVACSYNTKVRLLEFLLHRKEAAGRRNIDLHVDKVALQRPTTSELQRHLKQVFPSSDEVMCEIVANECDGCVRSAHTRMDFLLRQGESNLSRDTDANSGNDSEDSAEDVYNLVGGMEFKVTGSTPINDLHNFAKQKQLEQIRENGKSRPKWFRDVEICLAPTYSAAAQMALQLHASMPTMVCKDTVVCDSISSLADAMEYQSLADWHDVKTREAGFSGSDSQGTDRSVQTALSVGAPLMCLTRDKVVNTQNTQQFVPMDFTTLQTINKARSDAATITDILSSARAAAIYKSAIIDDMQTLKHPYTDIDEDLCIASSRWPSIALKTTRASTKSTTTTLQPAFVDNATWLARMHVGESLEDRAERAVRYNLSESDFVALQKYTDQKSFNKLHQYEIVVGASAAACKKAYKAARKRIAETGVLDRIGVQDDPGKTSAVTREELRAMSGGKKRQRNSSKKPPAKRTKKLANASSPTSSNLVMRKSKAAATLDKSGRKKMKNGDVKKMFANMKASSFSVQSTDAKE